MTYDDTVIAPVIVEEIENDIFEIFEEVFEFKEFEEIEELFEEEIPSFEEPVMRWKKQRSLL